MQPQTYAPSRAPGDDEQPGPLGLPGACVHGCPPLLAGLDSLGLTDEWATRSPYEVTLSTRAASSETAELKSARSELRKALKKISGTLT